MPGTRPTEAAKAEAEAEVRVVTPLARHLHYGLKGRDVTAVQLALRKAGVRHRQPTGRYGRETVAQVAVFKKQHGIRVELGYGAKTHAALWPSFGRVARALYQDAYKALHQQTVAERVVAAAIYGWAHRDVIHYTQDARRMTDFLPPPNVPNYTDCSAYVTWAYKSGGAPDPNGFHYNGYGFTGSQLANGERVSLAALHLADLVFYGEPVVGHVAVYVGSGKVVSHGSEAGPLLLDLHYRGDVNSARRYF